MYLAPGHATSSLLKGRLGEAALASGRIIAADSFPKLIFWHLVHTRLQVQYYISKFVKDAFQRRTEKASAVVHIARSLPLRSDQPGRERSMRRSARKDV